MAEALLLCEWLHTIESIEFGDPWLSCPCLLVANESAELLSLSPLIRVSGRDCEILCVRILQESCSSDSGYWQPCNGVLQVVEWRGCGYGRADLVEEG